MNLSSHRLKCVVYHRQYHVGTTPSDVPCLARRCRIEYREVKLRLRHNSIRLRLGKSEVELLRQGLECCEVIWFPRNEALKYCLMSSTRSTIHASLEGANVRIEVPKNDLIAWCSSEAVGISAEIYLQNAEPLRVLIEKDFRCLDSRLSEDQSDMFANPAETHSNCEPRL